MRSPGCAEFGFAAFHEFLSLKEKLIDTEDSSSRCLIEMNGRLRMEMAFFFKINFLFFLINETPFVLFFASSRIPEVKSEPVSTAADWLLFFLFFVFFLVFLFDFLLPFFSCFFFLFPLTERVLSDMFLRHFDYLMVLFLFFN